jgi:hypothetical protein
LYEIKESDILINGISGNFTPSEPGTYFCKVTNYLTDDNGNKYTSTNPKSYISTVSSFTSIK